MESLCCPDCGGDLAPGGTGAAGPAWGLLHCRACGAPYPVVDGVAVLLTGAAGYLDRCRRAVIDACGPGEAEPRLEALLKDLPDGAPFAPATLVSLQAMSSRRVVAMYTDGGGLAPHHPLSPLAQSQRKRAPGPVLAAQLRSRLGRTGLLVEAGCAAGALAADLDGLADRYLGLDLSFPLVHAARARLLGWRTTAAEFAVADAARPPVKAGAAGAVISAALLDLIPEPLAAAARLAALLAEGGALALSLPYCPEGSIPDPQRFRRQLADRLRGEGLQLELERDGVPWLLRESERRFVVYLCHLMIFRRAGEHRHG